LALNFGYIQSQDSSKFWEKTEQSIAIKSSLKKVLWLTKIAFFWKSKLLNPRSTRYAWGQDKI
jgi:hypothetical protein